MRLVKGGSAVQVDHVQAEMIARGILRRDGVINLASGFNLSADSERIILAAAYLDLLKETLPANLEISLR